MRNAPRAAARGHRCAAVTSHLPGDLLMRQQGYHRTSAVAKHTKLRISGLQHGSSRVHRAVTVQGKSLQDSLRYLRILQCSAAAAGNDQRSVAEDVQYWDVVEFVADEDGTRVKRLGLVQEVSVDSLQVAPLVEEDQDVWVMDGNAQEMLVPAGDVIQVVDHLFSQMQDTEHNPHGEHAHDVWQVLCPLPPEVFRGYRKSKA